MTHERIGMTRTDTPPGWKASFHGGHSAAYCDHAKDSLEDILEAAAAFGYHTFGVAEHAPRVLPEHLYEEERDLGWDVATLDRLFTEYAAALDRLQAEYTGRMTVLKGFEAEVVPEGRYAALMRGYRERLGFEYMVGSVHWVAGAVIDYRADHFARAVRAHGGLEPMARAYYRLVADMVEALEPEIVGHLDLLRTGAGEAEISTPAVRRAAFEALDVIAAHGALLDVNTGGYRKGFGRPFPAPWLVKAAQERGIGFIFGDDSHAVAHVGAGLEEARQYLLELGVRSVALLQRAPGGGLARRDTPLA